MIRPRHGLILLMLTVTACTVGPDYHAPRIALPNRFAASDAPAQDMALWWRQFDDPVLNRLIERALSGNLDMRRAAARVDAGRAQLAAVRGRAGPRVNAGAQAGYNRLSGNALPDAVSKLASGGSGSGSGGALGLPGEDFTSFQLGFDASWEIDLFGGQRRADEAADARFQAAQWNARDAQVTLTAEVARTYQDYRALQRRLALSDARIAGQRALIALARARAGHGLATTQDLRGDELTLEQMTATRTALAAEADAARHALATLLGLGPDALAAELADAPVDAPAIRDVPPGLPSELLERRPDLRAAERQLAAATADIGVATADLYPKFSLTGALNLSSRALSNIVSTDSIAANGGGRLSLPLVGRGSAKATVALRRAQADEALAAYQGQVVGAMRDVADALTRLAADRARVESLGAAERAAADRVDTAAVQLRHGLIPAASHLNAQLAMLNAREARIEAEGAAARDMIALYKALGGGWDERRVPAEGETGHGGGR